MQISMIPMVGLGKGGTAVPDSAEDGAAENVFADVVFQEMQEEVAEKGGFAGITDGIVEKIFIKADADFEESDAVIGEMAVASAWNQIEGDGDSLPLVDVKATEDVPIVSKGVEQNFKDVPEVNLEEGQVSDALEQGAGGDVEKKAVEDITALKEGIDQQPLDMRQIQPRDVIFVAPAGQTPLAEGALNVHSGADISSGKHVDQGVPVKQQIGAMPIDSLIKNIEDVGGDGPPVEQKTEVRAKSPRLPVMSAADPNARLDVLPSRVSQQNHSVAKESLTADTPTPPEPRSIIESGKFHKLPEVSVPVSVAEIQPKPISLEMRPPDVESATFPADLAAQTPSLELEMRFVRLESATPNTRTEAPRAMIAQIVDAIRPDGEQVVEVTLKPEELGRVRLAMTGGGDAQSMLVSVNADRSDTLDLMRRNQDILLAELKQMGFADVNLEFGGERGFAEENRADVLPALGDSEVFNGEESVAILEARPRMISATTGVDLRL